MNINVRTWAPRQVASVISFYRVLATATIIRVEEKYCITRVTDVELVVAGTSGHAGVGDYRTLAFNMTAGSWMDLGRPSLTLGLAGGLDLSGFRSTFLGE